MGVVLRAVCLSLFLAAAGGIGTVALAGEACKCRAEGANYEMGQIRCIRGQLARCEMNQNVPTWKVLADTCPESSVPSAPQPLAVLLPPSSLPHC